MWCFRDDCCLVITGDKIPEVDSRTEGSRPRPRTQKNRGQSQGQPFRGQTLSRPRTKDTAASVLQKKGLQKSFLDDVQFLGVARIFDWGGLNHKSHAMRSSKIFQTGSFCGTKISKGGRSEIVACRQVTGFCKERGIKLILEKRKYLTLETCWESQCNSKVSQTGGLGAGPLAAGGTVYDFLILFGKKSYFNAIESRVSNRFKQRFGFRFSSCSKYFSGSGLIRVHLSTIFEVQVWFRFTQVKYYSFRFGSGSLT